MGIRLHVIVEGQTEEAFVKKVLAPHLSALNVWAYASSTCGGDRFAPARGDLVRWMKEDSKADARFTTMYDLYRLPRDFPGNDVAVADRDSYVRAERLESALQAGIAAELDDLRLIPYLQVHEFEALLLAEPAQLKRAYPGRAPAIDRLAGEIAHHQSPELINLDLPPSKRIKSMIPEFEKGRCWNNGGACNRPGADPPEMPALQPVARATRDAEHVKTNHRDTHD